jgi:hypothetical protein
MVQTGDDIRRRQRSGADEREPVVEGRERQWAIADTHSVSVAHQTARTASAPTRARIDSDASSRTSSGTMAEESQNLTEPARRQCVN